MFGDNAREEGLERRLAAVEQHLGQLAAATAQAAPLLQDADHLRRLSEEARRLSETVQATVDGAARAAATVVTPRFTPRVNQVYRADGYGYITAYYVGGAISKVRLLVGAQHPPAECVGEANSGGNVASYAGAVVRPGEFWMLECSRPDGAGYRTVFTPLF